MDPNGYGADIAIIYTVVIAVISLGVFLLVSMVLRLLAGVIDYFIEKRARGTKRAALIGLSLLVVADIIAGLVVVLVGIPIIESDWGKGTSTTFLLTVTVSVVLAAAIVSRMISAIREARKVIRRGNVVSLQLVAFGEPTEAFRVGVAEMIDRAEARLKEGERIIVESDGAALHVLVVKP